jgi:hypothetical protein
MRTASVGFDQYSSSRRTEIDFAMTPALRIVIHSEDAAVGVA